MPGVSYKLSFVNRNIPVQFLLVSLFTLLTFVLLFVFRSVDDNRLTSWQYIFNDVSPVTVFVVLFVCVSAALLFAKISFSPRFPSFFLFVSSFVVAAFFWNAPEVIVDAARYFTQAKHLETYGVGYFFKEWGKAIQCWTDLPLAPFLYGAIFRFCGESRIYVQIFTTTLFSMTVVLTYLIGKELWDEETGLLAGALLLGMPYLLSQVPLMLVDVPTMFFLTLTIFTFMKGTTRGGRMMAYASVSLFLAIFSKYSTWPMLSVLAVVAGAYMVQVPASERKARSRRWVFIAVPAVLLAGLLVMSKYDVFSSQIKLLMTFQRPGLRRWGESYLSTFFFQIHPFITAAALSSVFVAMKKRDPRYAITAWLVIIMFVLQIKRIRYTLPIFPMIALMASYGLQQLRDGELRRFIVLCALISSLSIAVLAYRPFMEKNSTVNLEKAGEFLNTLEGQTVEVYTLPQQEAALNPAVAVPLLDLFTHKNILYEYDARAFPHAEDPAASPLRFTWEYINPPYYEGGRGRRERNRPVAVLSGGPAETLPGNIETRLEGYRLLRTFDTYEGVYSFRTVVAVYAAQSPAQSQGDVR